jgi:hypothetical protein
MLGFFGIFGRSRELRRIDQELRARGLHPRLMPEAVKLTALKLLREAVGTAEPDPDAIAEAAALLAYCCLGGEAFAEANDARLTRAVEARVEAATEAGDSLDARLVLLTLHASVIQPEVVERHGLAVD